MIIRLLSDNNPDLSILIKEAFDINIDKLDVKKALLNNVMFLCVFDNKKIIGTVMITKKYDPVKGISSYYLDYVSVLKSYQNRGIAKSLLLEIEKMAVLENISYIELTSNKSRENARKLYLSNGYVIRDTDVFCKKIK